MTATSPAATPARPLAPAATLLHLPVAVADALHALRHASQTLAYHVAKVREIKSGIMAAHLIALLELERRELSSLVALRHEMEPRPFRPCDFTHRDRSDMDKRIALVRSRIYHLSTNYLRFVRL